MSLTYLEVLHIKSFDRPKKISDSKGLMLLVMPNGSKYWRYNYRFSGKQKTLSLGVFPKVSLLEARQKRDIARQQLADGLDPSFKDR